LYKEVSDAFYVKKGRIDHVEASFLSILGLGLLLGLRHSLDADHLVAVSTIATRTKNPMKAGITGAFWGMGHSVPIIIIGIIVLMVQTPIPESLEVLFEGLVGLLLPELFIENR